MGVDKANASNQAAIRSLAPIEMARARSILGMDSQKMVTFEKIKAFLSDVLELTPPGSVFGRFHLSSPLRDRLHWEWEDGECFAYKGMKRIGLIGEYRYGVIYRIECWLEALGIGYDVYPRIERCIMNEAGSCSGDIRVLLSGEGPVSG